MIPLQLVEDVTDVKQIVRVIAEGDLPVSLHIWALEPAPQRKI